MISCRFFQRSCIRFLGTPDARLLVFSAGAEKRDLLAWENAYFLQGAHTSDLPVIWYASGGKEQRQWGEGGLQRFGDSELPVHRSMQSFLLS